MTNNIREYQERIPSGKRFIDGELFRVCKECYDCQIKSDKKHYRKVMREFFWIVVMFVIVFVPLIIWELTR